jgi:hypothetical protein
MEINQRELANHLPLILDFVFQGGRVLVTHDGVSKIEIKTVRSDEEQIEHLISSGKIRPTSSDGAPFQDNPFERKTGRMSALDALLAERYEDDDYDY